MAKERTCCEMIGLALSLFGIIGAILVFGWQSYSYFWTSAWTPISTVTAIQWLQISWATPSQDWLELGKLLSHLPLAVALLGISGIGLLFFAMGE